MHIHWVLAFGQLVLWASGSHVEIGSAEESSSTSSDSAPTDFGVSRADFTSGDGNEDPVVMERITNFKLDPNDMEILEDEDEDKPLELHVHCDRFLSAPAEHIEPLFREIPLHDDDNFVELTEDSSCTPHFTGKCHLITKRQMENIWEANGRKGIEALFKIKCLQRLSDFTIFEKGEPLEIIKSFPVSEWENWWAFSPVTILSIIKHHNYADGLGLPNKASQISQFLAHDSWKQDKFAWQFFDDGFLKLVSSSPTDAQKLTEMLAFNARFPLTLAGDLDLDELAIIPRWSVRVFKFILTMITEKSKAPSSSSIVRELTADLILAADRIGKLSSTEIRIKSAIKLAKTSVLQAPSLFFAAAMSAYDNSFKSAKQLRIEIGNLTNHENVLQILSQLHTLYLQEQDTLYTREELCTRFKRRGMKSLSTALQQEFLRDFIQMNARPGMSVKELKILKEFIKKDLQGIPEPEITQQEAEEGDEFVLIRKVPEKVRVWFAISWLNGCHEAFVHVCELLNTAWGSSKTVDELIIELALQDTDFVECALGVLGDSRKAIQLIMRDEPEEDFKLKLSNVPWEEVHNLPLEDQLFFKPSFDILVNWEDPSITYHWFTVKYTNENGVDGGGPRRNWIFKMLYAWTDPKRNFLKIYQKYIIPSPFVHYQVFYGLGRLIGKGLFHEAGLPFAFHPEFVMLLQHHDDLAELERCFKAWYEEEMKILSQVLEMAEGDLEEVEDLGLVAVEHWSLTDDACGSTIGINAFEAIQRGCRVPVSQEINGDFNYRTLEEWIDREGAEHKELPRDRQIQMLNQKLHHSYTFKPNDMKDVNQYVDQAREIAFTQFKAGIEGFLKGLNSFIDVGLMCHLRKEIMMKVFSPIVDIDVNSLLAAFQYQNAEGLAVIVSKPQEIPESLQSKLVGGRGSRNVRVGIIEAFKYAVSKLTMDELHGFVGQLTGSRVTGLGGFQPNTFVASFSRTPVTRPLIADESPRCSARKALAQSDQNANLELPFTASCTRSISIPLYATLEEVCLAILLVARASDEFPRT